MTVLIGFHVDVLVRTDPFWHVFQVFGSSGFGSFCLCPSSMIAEDSSFGYFRTNLKSISFHSFVFLQPSFYPLSPRNCSKLILHQPLL